jgi:hypothetical protein
MKNMSISKLAKNGHRYRHKHKHGSIRFFLVFSSDYWAVAGEKTNSDHLNFTKKD